MRSGCEKISTGVESESQNRLQRAIIGRRWVPLSKRRHCQERLFLFQCLSEPRLVGAGF